MAKAKRFDTLFFKGPLFPPLYNPVGLKLAGETLSPLAEEMIVSAAKYIETDYAPRLFAPANNTWEDLQLELTPTQRKLQWPNDFMPLLVKIHAEQEKSKEAKKTRTKEEKAREKAEKEALKKEYGVAILNGKPIDIAYMIEAPSWIITRGKDPRFGHWKYRVAPEDVYINIVGAKPDPSWKGRTFSDNTSIVTCKFKIKCGNPKSKTFKLLNKNWAFSAETEVRHGSNELKFDKTADILKNWKTIQKHITDACVNIKDPSRQESALIAYFVQQTGIRAGDTTRNLTLLADTVGASNLRVEHIRFK